MSLFRKPKKIQRRVFTGNSFENEEDCSGDGEQMDADRNDNMTPPAPPPPNLSDFKKLSRKDRNKESKKSMSGKGGEDGDNGKINKSKALLSFADDEDEGEIFQVRKSSHSKKVMRMLDKERRKKKREDREDVSGINESCGGSGGCNSGNRQNGNECTTTSSRSNSSSQIKGSTSSVKMNNVETSSKHLSNDQQYKNKLSDKIQTEIRTDDFVLVVKKSNPDIILNGRAALCAGRDDMSDEESDIEDCSEKHRFSKPERLKQMLESGSIPDAAMIHAARKRRQKAREQGDFLPIEEPKEVIKKGSRLAREDVEGDNSDDEERVDMNAITGIKEREERREQFYAVENDYSEEDSDHEMNEWENQQIRKGVTGAQLVNAQHESVLSRFMIKAAPSNALEYGQEQQSTATLLEQAYAKSSFDKPKQISGIIKPPKKDKTKPTSLRTPHEIRDAIQTRLKKLRELYTSHLSEIEKATSQLKVLKMEEIDCKQKAPAAAAKYRFYQEVKCYVSDLVDCLNEKTPIVNDLEKRSLQLYSKNQTFLIERRRQDVRDQAKEMAEATKPTSTRRGPENEELVRRTAEREGRRTRRRCEREKNDLLASHLDGMSSDDETSDRYQEQYQQNLDQLCKEADEIFGDVNDDFCNIDMILMKFFAWRKTDMDSYKDAFASLCLPKILGPLIRLELLTWSPLLDDYKDIEKMEWYTASMCYAFDPEETLDSLKIDPDVNLVPSIVEKIILPKITEIVQHCWDPLSTTQTLRLIGFINRLGRDFPLKESCKTLDKLFTAILDKMKLSLENDVFIPIFPKQVQEAKTSFFQRQFCSALKLFRNFLSWQGIIADNPLRELAIGLLLNRYLLLAMRVCSANDAISKAYIIVNTLPTVWLQPDSETLRNMQLFTKYIKQTLENCDATNPMFIQTCEKAKQILQRLHSF